jgi:hypothetical protein
LEVVEVEEADELVEVVEVVEVVDASEPVDSVLVRLILSSWAFGIDSIL